MSNTQVRVMQGVSRKLFGAFGRAFGEMERARSMSAREEIFTDSQEQLNEFIGTSLEATGVPAFGPKTKFEEIKDLDACWVFQSIVGPVNFRHGRKPVAACMAYLKNGKPRVAGIALPLEDVLAHATHGDGVEVEIKGRVSVAEELDGSIVSYGYCKEIDADLLGKLNAANANVRMTGCLGQDIVDVAAGCVDGLMTEAMSLPLKAAAELFVREAAGKATDYEGNPFSVESDSIVAGNLAMHGELLKLVK